MKILIGVLILVVAILGISPYFLGAGIEKAAQARLEQYRMPGYEYNLEVDRGYRSSVFSYSLSIDPEILVNAYDMSQEDVDALLEIIEDFDLNLYVQHGPLLTQNGLGLGLADAYIRIDQEELPELADYLTHTGVSYLFSAHGRIGFSGSGEAEYEIPAMQYEAPDLAISSSFSGLKGVAQFDNFGQYSNISGLSSGANIEGDEGSLEIGTISFSSEMTMNEESVWLGLGKGEFLVDSATFTGSEESGSMQGFIMEYAFVDGETSETTDIQYSLGLAAFETEEISLADAELAILYENISNQAINNYMDLILSMPMDDDEAIEAALLQFALTELPEALLLDPAIALPRVAFTYEGKSFEADARVAVDGQKLPVPVSFFRMDLLIPAITAELNLDADESLINDILIWQAATNVDASFSQNSDYELTPEMRQTMIEQQAAMSLGIAEAQGFVLRDNGRVRSNIRLEDRMLDINGTAMPLPF